MSPVVMEVDNYLAFFFRYMAYHTSEFHCSQAIEAISHRLYPIHFELSI